MNIDPTIKVGAQQMIDPLGASAEQPTAVAVAERLLLTIASELERHESGDPSRPTMSIEDLMHMAWSGARLVHDWPTEANAAADEPAREAQA